ncbi:MAG: GDSL-type esterase/lipase family protein [Halobacteriota archaeon]
MMLTVLNTAGIMTLAVLSTTGIFTVTATAPQTLTVTATAPQTLTVTAAAPQTIVCIGDSITQTWPEILQQRLGSGWTVIDKGVGGDTTAGMLSRFNADVIANHPQFVVICAGTAALGHGTGSQQIEPSIAMMCNLAVANGIRPVLCTIPPRENNNGVYIQSVNELNAWVKTYAASQGYDVIDFYSLLNDPANSWHYLKLYSSGDGIHPSSQGYQAMGAYVPLEVFATP